MGGFTQDVVENLRSVSQDFGCTDYAGEWRVNWCPQGRFHSGIDLAANLGQLVYTTRSGVVTVVGINYLGPYAVGIKTDEGPFLVFGHLNTAAVKVGDRVTAGQVIGACGTRGNSSGPHVHFAARTDAATEDVWSNRTDTRILDPTPYLTLKEDDMTPAQEAKLDQALSLLGPISQKVDFLMNDMVGGTEDNANGVAAVVHRIEAAVKNSGGGQAIPQDVQDAIRTLANHLK